MANSSTLTPKQHRAIATLLATGSVREAAEQAGIGERTLHTWLGESAFRDALEVAQSDLIRAHVAALVAELGRNRQAMIELRDSAAHESTKLRAAIALDDSLRQWRSLAEFERRLSELEAMVNEPYGTTGSYPA